MSPSLRRQSKTPSTSHITKTCFANWASPTEWRSRRISFGCSPATSRSFRSRCARSVGLVATHFLSSAPNTTVSDRWWRIGVALAIARATSTVTTVRQLDEIRSDFPKAMQAQMEKMWAAKLGLGAFNTALFSELVTLMEQTPVDYTIFFRELSTVPDDIGPLKKSFYKMQTPKEWTNDGPSGS